MSEVTVVTMLAALAGGLGAVLRFVLESAITARVTRNAGHTPFPWGTLVVNLSGSLMLGVLIGLLTGTVGPAHPLATVLGVGLLGGYTTFSVASYDTVRLLRGGRVGAAIGNSIGQLAVTVLAAGAGLVIGFALAQVF